MDSIFFVLMQQFAKVAQKLAITTFQTLFIR